MLCLGIDPGVTGGIAGITPNGWSRVADLPITLVSGAAAVSRRIDGAALARIIQDFAAAAAQAEEFTGMPIRCFCEAVHAREGDRNSMQSQGSLMRSLGAIEAVCDILGAPAMLVQPQAWQTFFGLVGKSHEQRAHGALPAAVQLAAGLHPSCAGMLSRVKDHNRAEALLIARYGLRGIIERGG